MIWYRLVHIVAGVVWAGSAFYIAFFVLPTARRAGPESRVFEPLMRRAGPLLGISMLLTVVSGFIMYARLSAGFNRVWVTSRPGLALAAGAVAALLALLIGAAVNGPAAAKMGALRKAIAAQGGAPTDAQTSALERLQDRLGWAAQVVAVLLLCAAAAMATARYL